MSILVVGSVALDAVETPFAQVEDVLAIFTRTETRTYCRAFLAEQCLRARTALASVPHDDNAVSARALRDMETLVAYVEAAAKV